MRTTRSSRATSSKGIFVEDVSLIAGFDDVKSQVTLDSFGMSLRRGSAGNVSGIFFTTIYTVPAVKIYV
jgi:hypothetical protein